MNLVFENSLIYVKCQKSYQFQHQENSSCQLSSQNQHQKNLECQSGYQCFYIIIDTKKGLKPKVLNL
jgi:hypothetical protein